MKNILITSILALFLLVGCSNSKISENSNNQSMSNETKPNYNPAYVEGSYAILKEGIELENPYDIYKAVDIIMSIQPMTLDEIIKQDLYSRQGSALIDVYEQLLNMINATNDNFLNINQYADVLSLGSDNYVKECKYLSQKNNSYFNEYKCRRDFILNDIRRISKEFLGKEMNISGYDADITFTPKYFTNNYFVGDNLTYDNGSYAQSDGEPMEYIPPEDGMEESDENQKFPYKEGQKLLVISDKAYNRAEPLLTGKKVGYWIKGDEVTVYDFTYFDDRWWIKTSPDKEWWVSERDLEVID